ncbi:PqaA protein [Serratia marcescens VGH107]|nr:PqaA protein [Serratia marcescens VGH107]
MTKIFTSFVFLLWGWGEGAVASLNEDSTVCKEKNNCNFHHVLSDYREELSKIAIDYTVLGKEILPQVEVYRYEMTSQSWAPDKMVTPGKWQHSVDIYIPNMPKEQRALVVVNNGINYVSNAEDRKKPTDFSEEVLVDIARKTHTIVISVSDTPNQYLTYQSDGKLLKEDDSVARSWLLFMNDPEKRKLMPLHIPMSASVSQAMRMAKKELMKWNVNKFIVTGVSKRGWATWLTAISNPDVEAIIPFAIDLLDTDVALAHMYRSYGENWPVAFYPYYKNGIDKLVKTPGFLRLMEIEDPLKYMVSIYRSRLDIPKYIVNASGDDFYTPDNSRFYYERLPGEKSLRVIPNTDHYGVKKFTEQSIVSFVNRYQTKRELPKIDSFVNGKTVMVSFSEMPVNITRWTAINTRARDFRYACNIRYTASSVDLPLDDKVEIPLNYTNSGWEATYIEATFNDGYVGTTQVYITPDDKYANVAPPSEGPTCQTLPGRGLGD